MDLLDGHETTNVQLTFNKDFAKRLRVSSSFWTVDDFSTLSLDCPLMRTCLQHNKQREELDRLQQKYGKDLDAAKPEKAGNIQLLDLH